MALHSNNGIAIPMINKSSRSAKGSAPDEKLRPDKPWKEPEDVS